MSSGNGIDHKYAVQIVCTLGPKSRSVEVLEELLRAGMSVARFNFSHGSHEYHQVRPQKIRNTRPSCPKSRCHLGIELPPQTPLVPLDDI